MIAAKTTFPMLLLAAMAGAQVPTDVPSKPNPAIPDSMTLDAGVRYDALAQTTMDVLSPKSPGGKRPAVLVIHGGGWVSGTKEARMEPVCFRYVAEGFVCANVEYRLAGIAPAPAAVTDVLSAAKFFKENAKKYGFDPNKLVVTGDSAGGHLALMVGLTPKSARLGPSVKVAAVINFYGITDVGDQLGGPNQREYAVKWVPEQQGRLELANRVSPITYVRKDAPPVLTIHGDADETVPYEHGVNLTRALRNAGADAEMINVPQGPHGFPKAKLDQIFPQIFAFLKARKVY